LIDIIIAEFDKIEPALLASKKKVEDIPER
jgi:hypothetical protein